MDIIFTGNDGRRAKLEVPCAEIVKRSPKKEQRQAVGLVCDLLGIKQRVAPL